MTDVPPDPPLTWDRRADRYAKLVREHPVFRLLADDLVARLAPEFGGRVADLGAGTGELAERVLELRPRARVAVVEPAPAMLAIARERLARHGSRVTGFHALRAEEFSDADGLGGPVEAVLASAAAHLFDDARTLPAVARALAPGGLYAFHLWGHAFAETARESPHGAGWRPALERAAAELGLELPVREPEPSGRGGAGSAAPRSRAGLEREAGRAGLRLESCQVQRMHLSGAFLLEFMGLDPAGLLGLEPEVGRTLLARAAEAPGPGVEAPVVTCVLRRQAAEGPPEE